MDLYKLFVTIAANNQEANAAIDETGDKISDSAEQAQQSQSKWSKALSGIGKAAAVVGKAVAVGLAAAASATAMIAKAAVAEYSNYEQLAGGTELLFGEAADFVMEKARQAYSTVQLSTNDYLTQVNGLSTGLKNALGGSAQAAAELADRVVQAEADVVAATGASQEAVQNAFNGIMKSNFTMVDNLQLGIAPTKEGFQSMIDSVNEYNAAHGQMTAYTIDNLADCQAALVDYIAMQGLAGYASKEASGTIQGSVASMKAAWSNMLVGLADSNADLDSLFDGLITSVSNVASNLIPKIQTILGGISRLISDLAPQLIAMIPGLVSEVVPGLISAAGDIINAVVNALPGLIDSLSQVIPHLLNVLTSVLGALLDALPSLINSLADFLISNVPIILKAALQLFGAIVDALPKVILALSEALPDIVIMIAEEVPAIIDGVVNALTTGIPAILDAAITLLMAIVDALPVVLQALLPAIPNLVGQVINMLFTLIPTLLQAAVQLFMALVRAIPQIIPILWDTLVGLVDVIMQPFAPIGDFFSGIWEKIKEVFSSAFQAIINIVTGAIDLITLPFRFIWENCRDTVTEIWEGIKNAIDTAVNTVKNIVTTVFNTIKTTITNIVNAVKTTISNVFNAIKTAVSVPLNAVKNTVDTIFNAIKTTISNIINGAKNIVKSGLDAIKGFFDGLKLKFPNIKLPHFSITGSFSLSPLSVPKLGIEWYKKAMDNAMLLNDASIFGMDSKGTLLGGGEAGQEVVAGSQTLMSMIQSAVSAEVTKTNEITERLYMLIASYLPEIAEKASKDIVLNNGVLVGQLAPAMDGALGDISRSRIRGQ